MLGKSWIPKDFVDCAGKDLVFLHRALDGTRVKREVGKLLGCEENKTENFILENYANEVIYTSSAAPNNIILFLKRISLLLSLEYTEIRFYNRTTKLTKMQFLREMFDILSQPENHTKSIEELISMAINNMGGVEKFQRALDGVRVRELMLDFCRHHPENAGKELQYNNDNIDVYFAERFRKQQPQKR